MTEETSTTTDVAARLRGLVVGGYGPSGVTLVVMLEAVGRLGEDRPGDASEGTGVLLPSERATDVC
jgi:hypothetical protein